MKKLGIIVALALIVTVGGVYATWNYTSAATGTVDPVTGGASIALTDKVINNLSSGTITTSDNTLSIQLDDTNNDHIAELVFGGSITVSFSGTDAEGTSTTIQLKCTASCDAIAYGDKTDIFTYGTIVSDKEIGTGDNAWVITETELKQIIKLNGDISAPTSDDYDKLAAAIKDKTITLTFEVVGASSSGS